MLLHKLPEHLDLRLTLSSAKPSRRCRIGGDQRCRFQIDGRQTMRNITTQSNTVATPTTCQSVTLGIATA